MSKKYVLTKEVKDLDGGYTPYIVRNSYNVPNNYPLYESPMRNPPTRDRSYTPRIGTSRRHYSPVSSYYGVQRTRSPLSGYYRNPSYRRRRAYSPVSSYYNPYGEKDFSHPGVDSPNIELGSDDALVKGVVDYNSESLIKRPVYHIPDDVDRNDRTDIKIKYGDKILFYVNVAYKSVRRVLEELYTDSINNANKGDKLPLIRIEANNLKANLWTKPENLVNRLSKVCEDCSPSVQLKDSKGNKVNASALIKSLKKALGVSDNVSKDALIGQKDSYTGAGVILVLGDSVVLFKNKNVYEEGGGSRKDKDNKDLRETAVRELQEESQNLFNIGKSHLNGNTASVVKNTYMGYFVKVEGVDSSKLEEYFTDNKAKTPKTEGWDETDGIVIVKISDFESINNTALKAKPGDYGDLDNVPSSKGSPIKISSRARLLLIDGLSDQLKKLSSIKLEYVAPTDSTEIKDTHSYVKMSTTSSSNNSDEAEYKIVDKDSSYVNITDDDDTWFFMKWFKNGLSSRRSVYSPQRRSVYSPHRRSVYSPRRKSYSFSPTRSYSPNEREIDIVQ